MKRYVLLENKEIVDRNETLYQRTDEILMIKQSDSLLDLVEELDCVEEKEGFGFIQVQNITEDGFYSSTGVNYMIEKKDVGAIWKRNGDIMRRYEV